MISKFLANRLKKFLPSFISEEQSAFDLLMTCITSVTLKINSEVGRNIVPTRGIKQREPISPYVFILAAKALSTSIKASVREGKLSGIKVKLSHTFTWVRDRVIKKLSGWKENFLSHVGKDVLTKSLIQVMPT